MGKLDATSVVNGPEDSLAGWDAVSWRAAEENVRRLRQRIFTASQAGDLKRVRNLQKLMLRSRASGYIPCWPNHPRRHLERWPRG